MKTILNPRKEEPEKTVAFATPVRLMEWNVERVTAGVAKIVNRQATEVVPNLSTRHISANLHRILAGNRTITSMT